MNTKPIHEVRLGAIKAAVWKNDGETNSPRYSVKFSRLYKDGDTWKSTESFGRDDLLLVAKVADQAHSWIHQQEQEESAHKKNLSPKLKWHLPHNASSMARAGVRQPSARFNKQ